VRAFLNTLLWLAFGVWPAASASTQPVHQTWRCEVVYAPARTVWPRTVRLAYDDRRLLEVAIDGVPVYRFAVYDALVLTSLDNERVRLDAAAMSWSSDFRGVASGEGRCERLP
jgi:hypothetical protein